MNEQRWGYMVKRFCDQGRLMHLLKDDGSPACGAYFYASAGMSLEPNHGAHCRRCERIAAKEVHARGRAAGKPNLR